MKVSELMIDLTNVFLGKIMESSKKTWKPEEIEREFVSVMYYLSIEYLKKSEEHKSK